jgi:hypothetical protein
VSSRSRPRAGLCQAVVAVAHIRGAPSACGVDGLEGRTALVSVSVSFTAVHGRPSNTTRSRLCRSRTVLTTAEHRPTDLESVLGATPRGFESRILRASDQRKIASTPNRASVEDPLRSQSQSHSSPEWPPHRRRRKFIRGRSALNDTQQHTSRGDGVVYSASA